MTWNTESVVSGGAVNRKKNSNHCHNKKRFTIRSRRPSHRHRVISSVCRCFSTNTDLRKQQQQQQKDASPSASSSVGPTPLSTFASAGWESQKEVSKREVLEAESSPTDLFPRDSSALCNTEQKKVPDRADPFWSDKTRSQQDIVPSVSILQDLYSTGGTGDGSEQHAKEAEVYQQSKRGSKLWRAFEVRCRGSKITMSKFTLRRKSQSEEGHTTEKERDFDTPEKEAFDAERPEMKDKVADHSVKVSLSDISLESPPSEKDQQTPETILMQDIELKFKSHDDSAPSVIHDLLSTHTMEDCADIDTESSTRIVPQARSYQTSYHIRQRRNRKTQVRLHRRPRKILVLGDMCCGKTNLISAYCRDQFSTTYTPTILHCYMTDAIVLDESIDLVVVEVSGRDDFEPLRRRAYHKTDAAILCYSVNNAECFERIKNFWVPELRKHAPKLPFVLVGLKKDLKDDARDQLEKALRMCPAKDDCKANNLITRLRAEVSFNEKFVSEIRGKDMARSVGADGFIECSSLYRDHTRDVFETVTEVALRRSRRVRRGDNRHNREAMCTIL